jgi:hypothetical protein
MLWSNQVAAVRIDRGHLRGGRLPGYTEASSVSQGMDNRSLSQKNDRRFSENIAVKQRDEMTAGSISRERD